MTNWTNDRMAEGPKDQIPNDQTTAWPNNRMADWVDDRKLRRQSTLRYILRKASLLVLSTMKRPPLKGGSGRLPKIPMSKLWNSRHQPAQHRTWLCYSNNLTVQHLYFYPELLAWDPDILLRTLNMKITLDNSMVTNNSFEYLVVTLYDMKMKAFL